jgi:hypothetical protein
MNKITAYEVKGELFTELENTLIRHEDYKYIY